MSRLTKGSIAAAGVTSLLAFAAPASFAMDNMVGQPKAEIHSLSDIPGDDQLEAAVTHDLSQIGLSYAKPEALTLGQLSELKSIVESSSSQSQKQQEARRVLNM